LDDAFQIDPFRFVAIASESDDDGDGNDSWLSECTECIRQYDSNWISDEEVERRRRVAAAEEVDASDAEEGVEEVNYQDHESDYENDDEEKDRRGT
jgi:hypothetical protein